MRTKDPVNRTFELYGPQIGQALRELKEKNNNFGPYAKFDGQSLTGCSYVELKVLEKRIRELTEDPEARLLRTLDELRPLSKEQLV